MTSKIISIITLGIVINESQFGGSAQHLKKAIRHLKKAMQRTRELMLFPRHRYQGIFPRKRIKFNKKLLQRNSEGAKKNILQTN